MNRVPLVLALLLFSCGPVLPLEDPFGGAGETPQEGLEQPTTEDLKILVLDVGQGDSTLVIGPTGKALLIDAGPPGEGIAAVLPAFTSLGIDHLNWILATHYDADHIGGISEVLRGADQRAGTDDDLIPSAGLIDRGDTTDKESATYQQYIEAASGNRREATAGERFDLGSGASAEVIVANGHYSDGRVIHLNPDEENEAAIGLLIQYGDFKYFTAGDLTGGGAPGGFETKDMETTAGEILGDIDIVHVGHHGSSSSTNETFLEEIKPEAAVISVGKDNDYGHPTEEVLNRLTNNSVTIYRTDLMGTLEIKTDGKTFRIR